jgi:hypothetical protein
MPSLRALLAFACFSLAGCQQGSEDRGVVSLADFAKQAEEAACTRAVRCGWFPDVATCTTASTWKTDQLVASSKAGRIQYDGKAAAACIEAVAGLGCNLTDQTDDLPPACTRAFVGNVTAGGACFVDDDCASGSCGGRACTPPAGCCAGACNASAPALVPAGGSCYPPGGSGECAEGTYCDNSSTGATCVTGLVLGQPCDPAGAQSVGCQPPGLCQPSASALGGTCMPPPFEGEPCDPSATMCNASVDFCDGTGLCVRKLAVGVPCPDGAGCVDYAFCASGTCVSQQRAGEACDDQQADTCMGTLVCRAGVCALPTQAVCP